MNMRIHLTIYLRNIIILSIIIWSLEIKYISIVIYEELYKITPSCLLSWQQPASILLGILNSNGYLTSHNYASPETLLKRRAI